MLSWISALQVPLKKASPKVHPVLSWRGGWWCLKFLRLGEKKLASPCLEALRGWHCPEMKCECSLCSVLSDLKALAVSMSCGVL